MAADQMRLMPVQTRSGYGHPPATVRESVYLAAYEVYSHVFGPQDAMVTGGCRGGFGAGELIAFLYARAFPQTEWSQRVDEALEGMTLGLAPTLAQHDREAHPEPRQEGAS